MGSDYSTFDNTNASKERSPPDKNGEYIYYHANGRVHIKTHYINNKLEGIAQVWFDNGQLEYEILYINDKRDGLFKRFYSNGTVAEEVFYINGEKINQCEK